MLNINKEEFYFSSITFYCLVNKQDYIQKPYKKIKILIIFYSLYLENYQTLSDNSFRNYDGLTKVLFVY